MKKIYTVLILGAATMMGCSLFTPEDSADSEWMDVHGAGCQRSDPKSGDLSDYEYVSDGYYYSEAPQGDAVRIDNYVRLVRDEGIAGNFAVVDTDQSTFYDDTTELDAEPTDSSDDYYGQDAQFDGNQPDYTLSVSGYTVYDNVTGLTWMRGPNTDLEEPVADDKMSIDEAEDYVTSCNNLFYGGYSDWRLPDIKELYSLILFSGEDISGYDDDDTSGLSPFIDDSIFNFAYGDTDEGERLIDSQYMSSNIYIDTTDGELCFGVNFADGRIKGYDSTLAGEDKTFFVQLVRGNSSYGENDFVDNSDGTITDNATGLMWSQDDSGEGMNWQEALAWAQEKNDETYLGYSDWRLPNVKELHSITDYTHAPGVDGEPTIDTDYFNCTEIVNEEGDSDFPWYWSGTTHANLTEGSEGGWGSYVAFGRGMGYSTDD